MPAALATQFYTQQAQFTLTTLVINTLKPVDQQYVALSCDTDGAYPAGYRFGFNGQQKDDEVEGKGNSLDFGARIYDSRLGRFLSIDPLSAKFPYWSTYAFAGNSPFKAVDLGGLAIMNKYYNYESGKKLALKNRLIKRLQIWLTKRLPNSKTTIRLLSHFLTSMI